MKPFSAPHRGVKALGHTYMLDMSSCHAWMTAELVEKVILDACEKGKCHVMKTAFHQFEPQGVSGGAILAESHIMIHTWPEKNKVSICIYFCDTSTDLEPMVDYLVNAFAAKEYSLDYKPRLEED